MIMNRKPTPIWAGVDDEQGFNKHLFECKLHQCRNCGHVQQLLAGELEGVLRSTYQSKDAQLSTPIGKGNWGSRRALQIMEQLDVGGRGSVLEIGCADGSLLEILKSMGFNNLVGIEPSIDCDHEKNGVKYIKAFADSDLDLDRKFNFIIAVCVIEHIGDVNGVMCFVHKHLDDHGEFFIEVPMHECDLQNGDPRVFVHEHIHYFTDSSLFTMFKNNGFTICEIKKVRDSYYVRGQKRRSHDNPMRHVVMYEDYDSKLDGILRRAYEIANKGKIAFHGVNNSLHNLLYWTGLSNEFALFDNDDIKSGKSYFNKRVQQPDTNNIRAIDELIVVPTVYREEIRNQYAGFGFKGSLSSLVTG
jgi:SAM-dependent methyltransferase